MVLVHMMKLRIVKPAQRVNMRTNNVPGLLEMTEVEIQRWGVVEVGLVMLLTKTQRAIITVPVHAHNVEVVSINLMLKVPLVLPVVLVDIYRVVILRRIIYPCHNVWLVVLAIIKVYLDLLLAKSVRLQSTRMKRENHHVKVVILATIQIKI